MFGNILAVVGLLAVVAAILFGIRAARRSPRRLVRWPASVVGSVLVLIGTIMIGASIRGMFSIYSKVGRPVLAMTVERTPERLERGRHIANSWCVSCHSMNGELPLSGGRDLADDIPPPIGVLPTGNLTPGGRIAGWSDGEIFRAIREGADPAGTKLLVMSAQHVRYLSDDDLKSVIAYLRSQPPVPNKLPAERLTFVGLVLAGASMFPHIDEPPPVSVSAPPRGITVEYGKYIASWTGCTECHGVTYAGNVGGVLPPAPNLHHVQGWTTAEFIQTMHIGTTPEGKALDPKKMPWKVLGRFDDDELTALHSYLKTVSIPTPSK